MRFLYYREAENQNDVLGVLSPGGELVFSLAALGHPFSSMEALIEAYDDTLRCAILESQEKCEGQPVDAVAIRSPLPHPRNTVVCVGLNYEDRAHEHYRFRGQEFVLPEEPLYLYKNAFRTISDKGNVPLHEDVVQQLDYECELAVVMAKNCDCLQPEEVFDYIFGYTVANDISARNLQSQFVGMTSKRMEGFLPLGPWIVTKDEFPIPPHLNLKTRVNGEDRQSGNTRDLLFDIPYLISELSFDRDLEAGDLILTGTPSGTAIAFDPPKFLSAGDVVECTIEGIGTLTNTIL